MTAHRAGHNLVGNNSCEKFDIQDVNISDLFTIYMTELITVVDIFHTHGVKESGLVRNFKEKITAVGNCTPGL